MQVGFPQPPGQQGVFALESGNEPFIVDRFSLRPPPSYGSMRIEEAWKASTRPGLLLTRLPVLRLAASVPPEVRPDGKVTRLNQFTMVGIDEFLQKHQL